MVLPYFLVSMRIVNIFLFHNLYQTYYIGIGNVILRSSNSDTAFVHMSPSD